MVFARGDDTPESELPEPGRRWGRGAESVLPYLTKTLQAKPSGVLDAKEVRPRDGHPVFAKAPQRG